MEDQLSTLQKSYLKNLRLSNGGTNTEEGCGVDNRLRGIRRICVPNSITFKATFGQFWVC